MRPFFPAVLLFLTASLAAGQPAPGTPVRVTFAATTAGDFVVQGGGYTVDGAEKPTRPPVPNESGNGLANRRGTVALARYDDPLSANSQFFVNLVDNPSLDPGPTRWGYAVIGRVVEGMDVIDRIASVATGSKTPFGEDVPIDPVVVKRATIVGATT